MAYAVAADVAKLLPGMTFSDTTKVTTADLTEILSQVEAMVDAALQNIYTVPITGSAALKVVKMLVTHKAAAMVIERTDQQGDKVHPKAAAWNKTFTDWLDLLEKETVRLTDAPIVNTQAERCISTGALDSDGNERLPSFTMDQVF
ncbi:MAG: hypothetical protein HOO67_06160 [Candidatus Peribacteraceae bacterium]|nr:hypothetical protein [Candidatus Peribacteraceae bacterium]